MPRSLQLQNLEAAQVRVRLSQAGQGAVFLDLVALNLPPLEAGLFSTFRAARFGATAVACPLPLAFPMDSDS